MIVNMFQTDCYDSILSRGSANFRYERALICFFDILGWKSLIYENTSHYLTAMLQILSVHDHMRSSEAVGGQVHYYQFSDSFVLIADVDENAAQKLFFNLQQIVEFFLEGGIVVRGAVSIGNVQHAPNLLVGPGLIRTYEIESRLSMYPRIVVDSLCEAEIVALTDKDGAEGWFSRDMDGILHFDYAFLSVRRMASATLSHVKDVLSYAKSRSDDASAKMKIDWLLNRISRLSEAGTLSRSP